MLFSIRCCFLKAILFSLDLDLDIHVDCLLFFLSQTVGESDPTFRAMFWQQDPDGQDHQELLHGGALPSAVLQAGVCRRAAYGRLGEETEEPIGHGMYFVSSRERP